MSEELITAYDIRGSEEDGLTIECAWNVGKALADWLPNEGSVIVTYVPARKHMAECVTEGLRLQGRDVLSGPLDRDATKSYIKDHNLAGGAVVGYDELEKITVIELYRDEAKLIGGETGLHEIHELVEAGNFVPAALKGDLQTLSNQN